MLYLEKMLEWGFQQLATVTVPLIIHECSKYIINDEWTAFVEELKFL